MAFIGPGGPEFLVVMLVLLLLFGAKDAPRMFRKLNEIINSVRNTAEGFKREILYSDIDDVSTRSSTEADDNEYEVFDYNDEYDEMVSEDDLERDYSNETFQDLEEDLAQEQENRSDSDSTEPERSKPADGEDDVRKA